MKHAEAAKAIFDLDDLERQISSAAAPRRQSSDDPLAELARIVGHGDRTSGVQGAQKGDRIPGSFEDFLKSPPRPVSGMMPARTPPIEPLFPKEPVRQAPPRGWTPAEEQVVTEQPELQLRPALSDDHAASTAADDFGELSATPGDAGSHDRADASEPATHTEAAQGQDPQFDAMLAEFEAAMRDVGGEKADTPATLDPAEAATVDVLPQTAVLPRSLAFDPEAELAGPVAVPVPARSRRGIALAGGVMGVALIGAASLLAFGGGSKSNITASAPVIAAKPGVTKERPANPGGVEVPNQDKEVLSPKTAAAPLPERIAPREEQPVDLNQAQRSAETPPIRQIAGVPVVAPASAPPPQQAAQPRPVASVPITIAGTPPAPPLLTLQPAVPAAVAPAPAPAPAATAPAIGISPAPPPVAAAPASPQPPAAEPRRVRAVPIRPEDGAPNRAQAQPRVVPPAARPAPVPAPATAAAEPDDTNAPLRITPLASRVPQQAQRAAAVSPGVVPASTPTAPVTTQSTTPSPAASGGTFAVQVAAEGSQDAAQAKFDRLRGQHGAVLGSSSPSIRSAEVNGRAVYRVRVGQMSREEAVSLCERLKASGGSCFVARN